LAGSLLAWTLLQQQQTVVLVDSQDPQGASQVAAGLVNPVVGRRLVKPVDLNNCWGSALSCYMQLAQQFGQSFFTPKRLLRLFRQPADADRYQQRCRQPEYAELLGARFAAGESGESVSDPYGGFVQGQAGYLDVPTLLHCLREHFLQQGVLCNTMLRYQDIGIGPNSVQWQGRSFRHIVFCEGARALQNPWFRWLPFQLSKGEIITVRSRLKLPKSIIHLGNWLLPINEHEMKVGATYEWQWQDEQPSAHASKQLSSVAEQVLTHHAELQVIKHQAGIRPTTRDKNPFIGTHPDIAVLHVFNGFGSRGALLIPYYAQCLAQCLLEPDRSALPAAVDIARFESGNSMVILNQRYLSQHVKEGDVAIDATVGNGHDSAFLALCVGQQGHVFGFDIQAEAIANTRVNLAQKNLERRVSLVHADHKELATHIPVQFHGQVSAITFNLGYLPGRSKQLVTQVGSTLRALHQALTLLGPRGILSVVCYRGHAEGRRESEAVQVWIAKLSASEYKVRCVDRPDRNAAPLLVIITKQDNPTANS